MSQPQRNDHDRFRSALAAAVAGTDHDDAEATGWVRATEDEYLLCQFFNGWDAVEHARAQNPQLVERALAWMRAREQQT